MKITATNIRKKDGTKLVNGYKLALQKSAVESIGLHEGSELVPKFEDGRITLTQTNRFIADFYTDGELWCYTYTKIGDNLYDKNRYVFNITTKEAGEILAQYEDKIMPNSMFEISEKTGNFVLIWKHKKYDQNPNYR